MYSHPFARALSLLVLLAALGACQGESYSESDVVSSTEMTEMDAAAPLSSPASGASGAVPVIAVQDTSARRRAPVLIRRADLRLRVDDYVEASGAVPGIVGRFDAYLAGEQESRESYRVSNTYTIRVAAAQFDSLMTALMDLADEVDSRSINVDDVTEEYVDVEGRLRARRAVEAQYVTLLSRASDVEEVLAVQTALAEVREEIESAEGRLRFLRDRAALSTVTLTLYESSPTGISAGPGFFSRLADGFGDGWEVFLGFLVGIVTLWPFWIVLGLGVWAFRRWRQRHPRTPRRQRPLARHDAPDA
ncbi:DUF4349 domain-containing protein [Rubricoccus marinus]|uniref:DUF4349 domain-containing protein n=1 Tax=Rubricoccus marinus TaxID=716817 RepID=A0A259U371_9BACT|nr:DUF4349 domain-containing protein [Rubricoccus marinus]OZC04402.1 hypothetical protein BSZ36_16295 [Rubricoccus marinus]